MDKNEIFDYLSNFRELEDKSVLSENREFWIDIIGQARKISPRPLVYSDGKLDEMQSLIEKTSNDENSDFDTIEEKIDSKKSKIDQLRNFTNPNPLKPKLERSIESLKNQMDILNNINEICLGDEKKLKKNGFQNQQALENLILQVVESLEAYEYALDTDIVGNIIKSYEFNYATLSPKTQTKNSTLWTESQYTIGNMPLDLIRVSESPPTTLLNLNEDIMSTDDIINTYRYLIEKNNFTNRNHLLALVKSVICSKTKVECDMRGMIYLFYISKETIHSFITICFGAIENGNIEPHDTGLVFSLIGENITDYLVIRTIINTKSSNEHICSFQEHTRSFDVYNFGGMSQFKINPSLIRIIFKLHHRHFGMLKKLILEQKYVFSRIDLISVMSKIEKLTLEK